MSPLSPLRAPGPCLVLPLSAGRTVIGSNRVTVLHACDGDAHREEGLSQARQPCGRDRGAASSCPAAGPWTPQPGRRRSGALGCPLPRQASVALQPPDPARAAGETRSEDPLSGAHTPGLLEQRHEPGQLSVAKFSAILLCGNEYGARRQGLWLSSFIPKE